MINIARERPENGFHQALRLLMSRREMDMYELQLVEGRLWNDSVDEAWTRNSFKCIINETAKRVLGIKDITREKLLQEEPHFAASYMPDNYNPQDYELCGRWFEAYPEAWPLIISQMPNEKTDINNRQAFSTDFIGQNYDYPEASYEERAKIAKAHKDYHLGLLYFWKTDPRTPKAFKEKIMNLGLPKDEFQSSGHWPFYMYIREARRLVGDYVMTQHDCQNTKITPDSVGMGSYTLDSHNASRYVTADGYVQNEGDVQVSIRDSGPYMISYGSIIPKGKDCRNLYVVCAVSSSHIAYGSIRMEPVFMILGQSAATAAVQCIDTNRDVQDIDVKALARTLRKNGQILTKGNSPQIKKPRLCGAFLLKS